ncbi:MAG: peptidase T [Parachlamydiaceae bacterium]
MDSLQKRFLTYVKIDTQSDEHSQTSPSTAKQLVLSHLLEKECYALGLHDISCSDSGIVIATIPATVPHQSPTIVWNSHIDTSPEYSGANVNPIVHHPYNGKDIALPCHPPKTIFVSDNPSLATLIGTTIITTDGTTLLGADDKSGIAVMMATAEHLQAHPEIPHGPIRLCFTVDEEIGRGTDGLDVKSLGGACGYTLDGSGSGIIEIETFSADLAIVTVTGINSHPSEAKAKGMVNAVRILAKYISELPLDHLSPESTEGREGFMHPYAIEGGVAEARLRIILRDFETPKLQEYADFLKFLAEKISLEHPQASIKVVIKRQYRNMRDGMEKEPRVIPFALEAMRAAGIEPQTSVIRGGTDGALMTEKGLPCPNLSSGQHNLHSPLEWTSVTEMQKAVDVLIQLAIIWGKVRP